MDRQALDYVRRHRWPFKYVAVVASMPSPQRFHDRNQRMVDLAESGDYLLAFPDADSRGTWDCYRRGKARGLKCYVVGRR